MGSPEKPALEGRGESDYERYIRVPELLSLQKAPEDMAHPDELIFQVEHQAMELWFKVVLQGVERAEELVANGKPLEAERLLERGCRIISMLADQLLILDTMPPWDYHTIRLELGRGSGQESPGFRRLSTEPRKLWPLFMDLLEKRDVDLETVYMDHHTHYDLFRLAEALTDFDMHYQMWRQQHVTFIKRVIGRDVESLKGYSVHELEEAVMVTQLFPELWQVRNTLTKKAGTSPSYG